MEAIENKEFFTWDVTQQELDAFGSVPKKYDKVFIPDENNPPPIRESIGFVNGVGCMKFQNVITIVGQQGKGKSSICEAICSKILNPGCDGLGFSFSDEIKRVVLFDFERRNDDLYDGWLKIKERAGMQNEKVENALVVGMMQLRTLDDKLNRINQITSDFKPNLVIIDDASRIVKNINDLEGSEQAMYFLRDLAIDYNLTIIATIHPNPGGIKPRGHIGSELIRESSMMFLIKTDRGINTLTTNWEHGKSRHSEHVESSYRFNTELKYFISTDAEITAKEDVSYLSEEEIEFLLKQLFADKVEIWEKRTLLDRLRFVLKMPKLQSRVKTSNECLNKSIEVLLFKGYINKKKIDKRIVYTLPNPQLTID